MSKIITSEYCLNVTDGTHDTPKRCEEGKLLITSKHILNGILVTDGAYKISIDDYEKVIKRSKVEQWDILFSMIGSVGEVYIERNPNPEYAIKNLGLFKMGGNKYKALKLYYYLKSYKFQKKLSFWLSGSIQSFVPLDFLRNIELDNIEDITDDEIDRIELIQKNISTNLNIIDKLNEYLQLLFHKWFIEFKFPNNNGKPYKESNGEIDEIIGKLLPSGWRYEELPKLCSVVDCLHSAKPNRIDVENENVLLQLFNIKEYGLLDLTEKYYITDEDYKLWTSRIEVTTGDILITNAGRVGAIAQVPVNCKCAIGRNITAIRPIDIPPTYLYLYLNSSDCAKQIKKNTDQGSFFGSLNVRGIKQLRILVPNKEILNKFEEQARVLREKIEILNIENQKLIELRDLLIKKLIK